uniref:THUMP-like domain-containing protein n=1 Tax=Tepidiforma sp. TaxID=2682230 RepID=UPI002ADDFE80
ELEAVQLGRELKELALWYGEAARPGHRRAVLLPEGATLEAGEAGPEVAIERAAVVLDPARRTAGGRIFDPADCAPPWDTCLALARRARAAVIKAAPGLDHALAGSDVELEAVQLGRELKELTLWYGEGARPGHRRAVLLPEGATLEAGEAVPGVGIGAPGRYLFDPESCVTRAGLVRELAARLGAWQLDARVAYLSSDRPAFDPLAATFEVLEAMPFSANRLRGWLREHRFRPGEIRRRAFPVEPEELRRLLGRLEGEPVTLLCTTLGGERLVFAARRLGPAGGERG